MKEIDQIDPQNQAKIFTTPKKKQKKQNNQKKTSNYPGNDQDQIVHVEVNKFDLGSSPRFNGSKRIIMNQHSTQKIHIESSCKKQYSPIIIKLEEEEKNSIKTQRKKGWFKNSSPDNQMVFNQQIIINIDQFYIDTIIKNIKLGYEVQIPGPSIFQHQMYSTQQFTQILTYPLNIKNSKELFYDSNLKTIVSKYQCYGCGINFLKSSALGGHLSKCYQKELHFKRLMEFYNNCQFFENQGQKINNQKQYQGALDENHLKKQQSVHKIKYEHQSSSKKKKSSKKVNHNEQKYIYYSSDSNQMNSQSLQILDEANKTKKICKSLKKFKSLSKISKKALEPFKNSYRNRDRLKHISTKQINQYN